MGEKALQIYIYKKPICIGETLIQFWILDFRFWILHFGFGFQIVD